MQVLKLPSPSIPFLGECLLDERLGRMVNGGDFLIEIDHRGEMGVDRRVDRFGCGFVPLPDRLVGGFAQPAGPTQPTHDLDDISTEPIVLPCRLKGVIDFLAVGFGPFHVAPGDDDENRSLSSFVAPAVFRNHT